MSNISCNAFDSSCVKVEIESEGKRAREGGGRDSEKRVRGKTYELKYNK